MPTELLIPAIFIIASISTLAVWVWCSQSCKPNGSSLSDTVKEFTMEHYIALIIVLSICIPALLQIVYSIPLSSSVFEAKDVLAFCAAILGLTGGAYSLVRKDDMDKERELKAYRPKVNVSFASDADKKSNLPKLVITNVSEYPISVLMVYGHNVPVSLSAGMMFEYKVEFSDYQKYFLPHSTDYPNGSLFQNHEIRCPELQITVRDALERIWRIEYQESDGSWMESLKRHIVCGRSSSAIRS